MDDNNDHNSNENGNNHNKNCVVLSQHQLYENHARQHLLYQQRRKRVMLSMQDEDDDNDDVPYYDADSNSDNEYEEQFVDTFKMNITKKDHCTATLIVTKLCT